MRCKEREANGGMGEKEMRQEKRRRGAGVGVEVGGEGCRDRESDFQRDNEPLNDG